MHEALVTILSTAKTEEEKKWYQNIPERGPVSRPSSGEVRYHVCPSDQHGSFRDGMDDALTFGHILRGSPTGPQISLPS
jgi:hypothetical protein